LTCSAFALGQHTKKRPGTDIAEVLLQRKEFPVALNEHDA
jgi:hypothetical protein